MRDGFVVLRRRFIIHDECTGDVCVDIYRCGGGIEKG